MGPWGLMQIFSQSETVEGWRYCNSLITHKPVLLSITIIATFIIFMNESFSKRTFHSVPSVLMQDLTRVRLGSNLLSEINYFAEKEKQR